MYYDTLGIVIAIPAAEFITFILSIILFKKFTPKIIIRKEDVSKIIIKTGNNIKQKQTA